MSRRTFLGTTAALSAGGLMFSGLSESAAASPVDADNDWDPQPPVRIYVVYIGHWTYGRQMDIPGEIQNVFAPRLDAAAQQLGDVEFIGKDHIAGGSEAAEQLLPKITEQKADAVLVIQLGGLGLTAAPFSILASTGLPVAVLSRPLISHDWGAVPIVQREGEKIIFSLSRDLNEVQRLAGLLRVPARMKSAKLIVVGPPGCVDSTPAACDYDKIKAKFGTEIIHIFPEELAEVLTTISEDEAAAEAENYWIKPAKDILEPSREEIVKACKVYFALKKLMRKHQTRLLTIKCLGGIDMNDLGFPCLGLCRILDDGGIGTCQADMECALTMMLMHYATGLPGFMANLNMDWERKAVILNHCVAPTKMAGLQTERLPFILRSHAETGQGVALEVLMDRDADREVTWARLTNNNEILVATGMMRGGYDFDDLGCRTKVLAELTSSTTREFFEKLGGNLMHTPEGVRPSGATYPYWVMILHRVMFYGNHTDNFRDLAQLMELKFMIEGKDWA
jgi:hypothetical protein